MADFQLTSTWEEIDEAGQNRVFYVVMDSSSTALSTAADVYAALSAVPTRAVMLIDNDGAQCVKAPSSSYLDTVTFIRPTETGYQKYVLDSTGHVTTTSHDYSDSFVVNIYTSGSALACDKTLSEIADALSTNGVVGCITPAGSGALGYADTNVAKFNVIDTSGSAPVLTVYAVDRFGSVTETDIAIGGSGSATGVFGFVSIDAYRTFRISYPDAIVVGDQVWIRGGTIAGASHTLYKFVAADIPDHLQKVYAIDDPFLVTVTNTNGYVADRTYAQIVAAYNDGQRPVLMTEFGQMVPVVGADSNGVRFSGAVDSGSGFWIVTYTIGPSGITARGVMTDFLPIFLSVSNGVYDVAQWPSVANGIAPCITAMQSGADVCVVVPGANDAIIHPMTYYVVGYEIRFSGLEVETVSGVEYTRAVTYIISVTSAHVRRVVGQTVTPPGSSDIGKVWTATATGKAGWVTPSGGGGSGAELFEVTISVSGSVYSASETVADIMTAYQSGKLVKYYNEVGAEGLLFAAPTAYGITFVCFDDSDGGHPTMMTIYSIAADGTVTVSSEDILNSLITPGAQTRTASQMASGLLAISNVVYTITGDATGFVLTNSANPITTAGECVEIRLTVGSTAITTPTWPSWAKLMNGWDGNFSANTYYDIIIDDAGNVYHSTREVSA